MKRKLDKQAQTDDTANTRYARLIGVTLVKLACLALFVTVVIPSVIIKTQIAQPTLRYLRKLTRRRYDV